METNNTQRQLVCEACGASFGCYPSLDGPSAGCWCAEVKVSEDARKDVRSKYGDCICPECLVKFAEATQKA